MAKKDGLKLPELGAAEWIRATGTNGEVVDYALLPMATVSNLTDPDGQIANTHPVYYLAS